MTVSVSPLFCSEARLSAESHLEPVYLFISLPVALPSSNRPVHCSQPSLPALLNAASSSWTTFSANAGHHLKHTQAPVIHCPF